MRFCFHFVPRINPAAKENIGKELWVDLVNVNVLVDLHQK